MTGTVIRLLPNRGFGFVRGEDGLSRFFAANDVEPRIDFDTMREGQAVEFTPALDDRAQQRGNGQRAVEVKKIS